MNVIEAPMRWEKTYGYSLFLAGGISNCPDWQADAIAQLQACSKIASNKNISVLNPRRAKV